MVEKNGLISEAQAVYAELKDFHSRPDISLELRVTAARAALHWISLYGSEMWSILLNMLVAWRFSIIIVCELPLGLEESIL